MPLFRPLFIHHNDIILDKDDDLASLIPAAPPRRLRLIYFAPIFIHNNTIKKVSPSNNRVALAVDGIAYCDNSKVFDIQLVRNSSSANGPLPKQSGGVLMELGEKPQLKILDQDELDIKWNQTKQRLGEAKASFQESYKRLEDELTLVKTKL
jgi:hypothetical protein